MSSDTGRIGSWYEPLTADIAHELRTPLTVIRANIDGLRDGTFKPTPTRFDAMQAERQHLQRLVEDLRTLSLADAGELPMQRVPTSCLALLDRLAASHAPQAGTRNIALQVSAEPELPDIVIDPERMIQVLGNLVTNALRYTPPGGQIALAVGETGVGIAKVIIEAHDGRLEVESEPGRGTTFTVLLTVG
jgi:two-component system, OmpR family, sensor histidine kinase BaeS